MARDSYHHGALREALLASAGEAVEKGGPEAVSLRELAAALGVSRSAPYRHFEDREALLAAVAAKGFAALTSGYSAALGGKGDGRSKLWAANVFHFDFALKRPGLHKLLFESDLLNRTPPPAALAEAALEYWRLQRQAVEDAFPAAGQKEVNARAIAMWSTIHGFLALARAGRIAPFMIEPLSHEETVKAVLDVAIGGRGGAAAADAALGTAGRARARGSFGKALGRLGVAWGGGRSR